MKRLMHAHFREAMHAHDFGLTPAQVEALFGIKALEPVAFKDLGAHLSLQPAAVTQTVDALAHAGFVARVISDEDRRTWYLSLTDQGKIKLAEFEPYIAERRRLLSDALTDTEIDEFIRLQQKLINRLQSIHKKQEGAKHHG